MSYYICYSNEDRLIALQANQELNKLGIKTCFIDRDGEVADADPLKEIMTTIKSCENFIILHSAHTNHSVLSQIEITYSRNIGSKTYLIKIDNEEISDAIKFELSDCKIFTGKNLLSTINNFAQVIKKGKEISG